MEGHEENTVTPKMTKMIDQLSKDPLEDIEKILKNYRDLQ